MLDCLTLFHIKEKQLLRHILNFNYFCGNFIFFQIRINIKIYLKFIFSDGRYKFCAVF